MRTLTPAPGPHRFPALQRAVAWPPGLVFRIRAMKITNSLRSAKARDKDCRIVRRKGRVYVINKKNPRYKARQG